MERGRFYKNSGIPYGLAVALYTTGIAVALSAGGIAVAFRLSAVGIAVALIVVLWH